MAEAPASLRMRVKKRMQRREGELVYLSPHRQFEVISYPLMEGVM